MPCRCPTTGTSGRDARAAASCMRREVVQVQDVGVGGAGRLQRARPARRPGARTSASSSDGEDAVGRAGAVLEGRVHRRVGRHRVRRPRAPRCSRPGRTSRPRVERRARRPGPPGRVSEPDSDGDVPARARQRRARGCGRRAPSRRAGRTRAPMTTAGDVKRPSCSREHTAPRPGFRRRAADTSAVETGRPPGSGRSQSPRGRLRSRPPETSDGRAAAVEVDRGLARRAGHQPGELVEREAGVVGASGRRRRRASIRRRRARPSAARGWRPSVMSESNWRAPAEKPSASHLARVGDARRRRAAGRPAAGRRAARREASRRAIRATPPCDVHARAGRAQGASNGTWRRATPRVRSSPSGTPAGRVKKPPTSASCTPRAAHQAAGAPGRAARRRAARCPPRRGRDVDRRRAAVGERRAGGGSGRAGPRAARRRGARRPCGAELRGRTGGAGERLVTRVGRPVPPPGSASHGARRGRHDRDGGLGSRRRGA